MSTCAPALPTANPFSPDWVQHRLLVYAERARSGESSEELRDELLLEIWPWAVRTADRMARTLPAGADADGLRSDVVWEIYKAVERLDWCRHRLWPSLLKAHLRGAYSTAARRDDLLTRGQRTARRAYLEQLEQATQELGRLPSGDERLALARHLAPYGDAAPVMMGRSMMVSWEACDLHQAYADESPEDVVLRRWTSGCVRRWIAEDLPPQLARETVTALERGHLAPNLRQQLRPFVGRLVARLGDEH